MQAQPYSYQKARRSLKAKADLKLKEGLEIEALVVCGNVKLDMQKLVIYDGSNFTNTPCSYSLSLHMQEFQLMKFLSRLHFHVPG